MKIKNRIIQIGCFFITLILVSCVGRNNKNERTIDNGSDINESVSVEAKKMTSMHNAHNILAENFAHKDIIILEKKYPVSEETRKELEQVLGIYLKLKNALFQGNSDAINNAIGSMQNEIDFVNPESLDGKGLDAWNSHMGLYKDKLREMKHVKGLENKRSYFSHISEIMYCTIKSFGLKEGNLYTAFCPMAFEKKGAYWITDNKQIQNPYFGDKMPKCGEIKEEL